jgi:hypothetical protein
MLQRKERQTKPRVAAAMLRELDFSSSEQEVFEYTAKKALEEADSFVANTQQQRAQVLQINNIDPYLQANSAGAIHRVSPKHVAELLETLYSGFGAENPTDDLTKWVYDAKRTEHVAVTPTESGFGIVETRFRLEESNPSYLPAPQECGLFTLDFVRPSE